MIGINRGGYRIVAVSRRIVLSSDEMRPVGGEAPKTNTSPEEQSRAKNEQNKSKKGGNSVEYLKLTS